MEELGIIYCCTNLINDKKYVGQTHNLSKRIKQHEYDSIYSSSKNYHIPFHNAIRKYGIGNFSWEILEDKIETQEELNFLEKYYIECLQTLTSQKGYNCYSANQGHYTIVSETKEKMALKKGVLTKEEVIALRISYSNHESPSRIYEEKYKERMKYSSFLNIWSGRRYSSILPELIELGRHTKLNEDIVAQIRFEKEEQHKSYSQLSKKFNISKGTIADICKYRTWKTIKPVQTILESEK